MSFFLFFFKIIFFFQKKYFLTFFISLLKKLHCFICLIKNSPSRKLSEYSIGACHRIVFEINSNGLVDTTQSINTGPATLKKGILQEKVKVMTVLFKISFTSTLLVESFELMTGCSNSNRRSKYLKPNLVSLYIYNSFCKQCSYLVFFKQRM